MDDPSNNNADQGDAFPWSPTPLQVSQTRQLLLRTYPPEIAREHILEAHYFPSIRTDRTDSFVAVDGSVYTVSDPLPARSRDAGVFVSVAHPMKELRISIFSHDQGWSSYPADHGTYRNSWIWFKTGLARRQNSRNPVTQHEGYPLPASYMLVPGTISKFTSNRHAVGKMQEHRRVWGTDASIVWNAMEGDRVVVWAKARFPGWVNHVQRVIIVMYWDA